MQSTQPQVLRLVIPMATLIGSFCFYISLTLLFSLTAVSSFSPVDHYLLNCGSHEPTVTDADHRRFTGDSSGQASRFLSASGSILLAASNPPPNFPPIYRTARAFTRPSSYHFEIGDAGTHLVRLHFQPFDDSSFNLFKAQFHVLANGFFLLNNFSVGTGGKSSVIRDYVIWVDSDELEITFLPSTKSSFAFVNAIEVISAPKDLIVDVGQLVSFDKNVKIYGLLKNGYETVHRVNVGGPKVTPFNDSLWRTWVSDNKYLKSSDGSSRLYFSGKIEYQTGGVSREVCPDNVYNTARVIRSTNDLVPQTNITWEFPVVGGYKYLVRMHFCDIASITTGLLVFNVYVNGNMAYENLDLTSVTYGSPASPFYADFVVDGGYSGVLSVSVGPSNMSVPRAIDAILNGIEIMKMNNSMGSLDGEVCAHSVLKRWSNGNIGVVVPLVAAVFFLVIASIVLRRRTASLRDSVAWSRLPLDSSEVNMKSSDGMSSGKL